jgi:hypothetical protein
MILALQERKTMEHSNPEVDLVWDGLCAGLATSINTALGK